MVDGLEGFLCPECMLNLDSTSTLMTHFDTVHTSSNGDKEKKVVGGFDKQITSPPNAVDLVKDYERLVLDYSNRAQEMNRDIQELSSKTAVLQSETRVHDLESQLEEVLTKNKMKDETVTHLELKVSESKTRVSELQALTEEYELKISELQNLVDSSKETINDKDNQITQLKAETRELTDKIIESQMLIKTLSTNSNESLEGCQSSVSDEIEGTKHMLCDLSRKLETLRIERDALISKNAGLESQLKVKASEQTNTMAQMKEEAASLLKKIKGYENSEEKISNLLKQVIEIEFSNSVSNNVRSLVSAYAKVKLDLTEEVESVKKQLLDANAEISTLTSANKSLNEEKADLMTRSASLESQVTVLQGDLNDKVKEFKGEIETLNTEISRLTTNCANLKTDLNNKEMERQQLATEAAKLRELSTRLESDLISKLSSEETQNKLIAGLKSKNSKLSEQIEKIEAETKAQLQISAKSIADLSAEVTELNQKSTSLKSIVSEKEELYKAQMDANKQLTLTLDTRTTECNTLTQKLDQVQSELTQRAESILKLNSELTSMHEEVSQLKTSESALRSELASTVERMNNEHSSTQLELQTKLDSTLMEQQTLMDQFIASENKVAQMEAALSSCHDEMKSLQGIVLDLGRQNQTLQIAQERLSNRQWVDDDSAASCSNCQKEFSLSLRKHHCRRCGEVFCATCSLKRAPTPASKTPQRVCDVCFSELTGVR